MAVLASFGCAEGGTSLDEPPVELVPSVISVEALVGEIVETPIRLLIRERGVVESLVTDPPDSPFTFRLGNQRLEPGELEGRLTFEPPAAGTFAARFTLKTSAGSAGLEASGVARAGGFSHCEALDFGRSRRTPPESSLVPSPMTDPNRSPFGSRGASTPVPVPKTTRPFAGGLHRASRSPPA